MNKRMGWLFAAAIGGAAGVAQAATLTAEADAFIHGNSAVNNGGLEELHLKNDATVTNARKVYFRIDASSAANVTDATVELYLRTDTPDLGGVSGSFDYTFGVYGLNAGFAAEIGELGEDWAENTIIWTNAPANSDGNTGTPDASESTYLGSFTPDVTNRGTTGQVVSLTGGSESSLVSFLRDAAVNGQDGKATFIVVRETLQPNGSNTVVQKLASREYSPSGGSAGDWAPSVHIATAVHESFDYSPTPTELNGESGGTGFDAAWSTGGLDAGTDVVTPTTQLEYIQDGVWNSGGDRALAIGSTPGTGSRSLETAFDRDVYVSFLVRLEDGALTDNDFIAIGLGANDNVSIGVKADEGGGGGTKDFFVRTTSSNSVYAGDAVLDETVMIVGRLFKSGAVDEYDRFSLWVNPGAYDELIPLVTAAGASDRSIIDQLYLRTVNIDPGDLVLLDELRVGSTWRSVVPIPAPSALPAGLVLTAAILSRRRGARRRCSLRETV